MNFRHFYAVFVARNREFFRDRSSWAWNLLFPFVLVAALAVAFADDGRDVFTVGVYTGTETVPGDGFFATRFVDFVSTDNLDASIEAVRRHSLDLLVDETKQRYWMNDSSPNGYFIEKVFLQSNGSNYIQQTVTGESIRYIDWVVPGLLSMNLMFSCLFGVGYVIVRYRKSKVLRRFKTTPLQAFEFLLAQVASRLWLAMAVAGIIFFGSNVALDLQVNGSYFDLMVVFTIGSMSLISMGLLVASRTSSEELAGGLLNVFSWPMLLLSGVWFSLESAHPGVQFVAQFLPLTHLVDAARAVMIDGATLVDVGFNLVMLLVTAFCCLLLGSWLFRWE